MPIATYSDLALKIDRVQSMTESGTSREELLSELKKLTQELEETPEDTGKGKVTFEELLPIFHRAVRTIRSHLPTSVIDIALESMTRDITSTHRIRNPKRFTEDFLYKAITLKVILDKDLAQEVINEYQISIK